MIWDAKGKMIGEVRGYDSILADFGGTQTFAVNGIGSCAGIGGDVVLDGKIAGFFDRGHLGDIVLPGGFDSSDNGYIRGKEVYTSSGEYMGYGDSDIDAGALLFIFLPELIERKEAEETYRSSQSSTKPVASAAAAGAALSGAVTSYNKKPPRDMNKYGKKSRVVSAVLAILFGAWGLHKFYLGCTKEGIIMLAVSIGGSFLIPAVPGLVMEIVAILEAVNYLTRDNYEFYITYELGKKAWF